MDFLELQAAKALFLELGQQYEAAQESAQGALDEESHGGCKAVVLCQQEFCSRVLAAVRNLTDKPVSEASFQVACRYCCSCSPVSSKACTRE